MDAVKGAVEVVARWHRCVDLTLLRWSVGVAGAVFGCGSVAASARSWVQPVAIDRVVVRCNDSDTSWTLVCDGDVWRSTAGAVTNCSTTAALTGDNGPSHTHISMTV